MQHKLPTHKKTNHIMKKFLLMLLLVLPMLCMAEKEELYIFGGTQYDVYLGKFNAPPTDPASIWNENGLYGNKNNPDCIWNVTGTYGNPKSKLSPWNPKTANVPFLLTDEMKDRGTFSIYSTNYAAQFICENYKEIVSGKYPLADWYEAIFGGGN